MRDFIPDILARPFRDVLLNLKYGKATNPEWQAISGRTYRIEKRGNVEFIIVYRDDGLMCMPDELILSDMDKIFEKVGGSDA